MTLIRPADLAQLLENDRRQRPVRGTPKEIDFIPVVRLHLPFSRCVWLLTEVDNEDQNIAFGLCQIFEAELGSVYLPELEQVRHGQLRVIQDINFKPAMTIGEHARAARMNGGMIPGM